MVALRLWEEESPQWKGNEQVLNWSENEEVMDDQRGKST